VAYEASGCGFRLADLMMEEGFRVAADLEWGAGRALSSLLREAAQSAGPAEAAVA
jgi:hypothetical protein